jgi:hypothetical protein
MSVSYQVPTQFPTVYLAQPNGSHIAADKTPAIIMFAPTVDELAAIPEALNYLITYRGGGEEPNLQDPWLHVSSSDWQDDHLKSLQVVPLLDLDPNRLIPSKYWGDSDSKGRSIHVSRLA